MPVIKIKVERALLQDRVRCLADDFFQVSRPIVLSGRGWVPAVDIYEGPDAVYVVADTAGADKEASISSLRGNSCIWPAGDVRQSVWTTDVFIRWKLNTALSSASFAFRWLWILNRWRHITKTGCSLYRCSAKKQITP